MIFHNALCTLLERPSRKSVFKLKMLPRRYLEEIAQLLEGNYFTHAARSRITTNLEQEVRDYVYTFMYPDEYTLTESIAASCSIGERDSHSSTSGNEELDDSEDEDECQ